MTKKTNSSLSRLESILSSMRKFNKLFISENNISRLIQGVCDIFVTERLFHRAWIVLNIDSERFSEFAVAGEGLTLPELKNKIRNEGISSLIQNTISKKSLHIQKPVLANDELKAKGEGIIEFLLPLMFDNHLLGVLSLVVPAHYKDDQDERALIEEFARDLAFIIAKLQKSHDFDMMFDLAPEGIILLDEHLNIKRVNDAFCKISGMEKERLEGFNGISLAKELLEDAVLEKILTAADELLKDKKISKLEFPYKNKILSVSVSLERLSDLRIVYIEDVTQHNKDKSAVLNTESKFQKLVEALYESVFVIQDGLIKYVNPALCKLTSYSEDELLGESFIKFISKKEAPVVMARHQERLKGNNPSTEYETVIKTKPGKNIDVFVTIISIQLSGKQAFQGVLRDISEQKLAIKKLEDSESKFKFLSKSTFEGIVVHKSGLILDINESFVKITGYPREEALGKNLLSYLYTDEDRKEVKRRISMAIAGPYVVHAKRKDGSSFLAELEGKDVIHNGELVRIAAVRDVTEREKLMKQLEDEEMRMKTLLGNLPGMAYKCRFDSFYTMEFMSSGCIAIYGYKPEDIIANKKRSYISFIHPDDQPYVRREINNAARTASTFEIEYRIFDKAKKLKWVWERGRLIKDEDGGHLEGFVSDITLRKQAELELIQSKSKYKALFDAINDAVFVHPFQQKGFHKFIEVNAIACSRLGYSRDEFLNMSPEDISFAEDLKERGSKKGRDSLLKNKWSVFETSHKTKDGIEIPVEISSRLFEMDGQLLVLSLARDISRRKEDQKKLRDSELRLQTLSEATFEAIFISEKGICIDQNNTAEKMFGYKHDEAVGRPATDWIAEEYKVRVLENIKNDIVKPYDAIALRKDGSRFPCEIQARTVKVGGKIIRITALRDITERKKAENQLRNSEELFRSIFANKGTATAILDQEGKILLANARCVELSGFSILELQGGMTWMDLTYEDDLKRVMQYQNTRNNDPENALNAYELRMVNRKGEIKNILLNIDNIQNTSNKVVSLMDITDRKKAETELRKSEEKFRSYLQSAPYGIFVTDNKGSFVDVNDVACLMSALSFDELLSMNIFDILKDDVSDAKALFDDLVNNNKPISIELPYLSKNGDQSHWLLKVNRIANDRFIGFASDISQRKADEAKMLQLLHDQQIMLDNDPAFIIFKDTKNKILRISKTVSQLTGLPKEEIEGKDSSLIYPEMAEKYYQDDLEVIREGKPKMGIIEPLYSVTGEERWLLTNKIPYIDKEDKISGIILFSTDITDLKKFEDELLLKNTELKKAKEKAEESDRLKSAFLANMSHEIRTPMNGIMGFADLLKEPDLTGDERLEYINIIQRSGDRMLNTINDLIDVSKIESGLEEIRLRDFNIKDLVKEIFEFFRPEAEKKGVSFKLIDKYPDDAFLVYSDSDKLSSIFTNLIKNAIKFTSKGKVEIYCGVENGHFAFTISDTGVGIPSDRLEAVFNRFVQADIGDTRVFQGSGLGLSISRSYTEMLGGKIWLESEEGKGSTFFVKIPLESHSEKCDATVYEGSPTIEPNLHVGPRVLIAEDDEASALHLSILLRNYTSDILIAENGEEAIEILTENPDISLIFMDMKMPNVSGYEAVKRIRKTDKDVYIIAQTAYAMSGDREKIIAIGCNDYISKPIDKQGLMEVLKRFSAT